MVYLVDTSVFTQDHRLYYAFDIAPLFWAALAKAGQDGRILSPRAVYAELMNGDDELKKWAKQQEEALFVEPDAKVVAEYGRVVEDVNSRYRDQHQISDFLRGADPWVVAHARAHGLTVATMEIAKASEEIHKPTGKIIGRIKIPNVCDHYEIKTISTYDLVRALGAKVG